MSYEQGTGERGFFAFNEEGKLVQVEKPKPITVNAPFVITDEIPPTMSMTGTDKYYTSKSKLRQEYKDLGFVETGGQLLEGKFDKAKFREKAREATLKALNDARYGMAPVSEIEKEANRREVREWKEQKKRMKGCLGPIPTTIPVQVGWKPKI